MMKWIYGVLAMTAMAGSMTGLARAQDAACSDFPKLAEYQHLGLGRILPGTPRVHFQKSGDEQQGCPGDAIACQRRAFLVPGDTVMTGVTRNGLTCAGYVSPKGADTLGWLPTTSIAPVTGTAVSRQDWLGTWIRTESEIAIAADKKSGGIEVEGQATWGAQDQKRVARGGVNLGSLSAKAIPHEDETSFAVVDSDETVPIASAPETACKVWMRRLGPWLLVDDNNECGGLNVTFRGLYTRKP